MFDSSQKKDDFQVNVLNLTFSADWNNVLSARIGRVDIDLVNRSLVLKVHQLKAGVVQDVLFTILNDGGRIDQISVRPAKSDKTKYEYIFFDGKVTGHKLEFNYGKHEDAYHVLTVGFRTVVLRSSGLGEAGEIVLRAEDTKTLLHG